MFLRLNISPNDFLVSKAGSVVLLLTDVAPGSPATAPIPWTMAEAQPVQVFAVELLFTADPLLHLHIMIGKN